MPEAHSQAERAHGDQGPRSPEGLPLAKLTEGVSGKISALHSVVNDKAFVFPRSQTVSP